MTRVLTAVVLVPLVLLVVFKAPLWLFAMVVALVAILALYEYLNIAKAYGIAPLSRLAYLVTLLLLFGTFVSIDGSFVANHLWLKPLSHSWIGFVGLALVFGIPVVFRSDMTMALAASGISAFGPMYLGTPLATLILLRATPSQGVFLLFALFSVWAGDTAAYYAGRALGRHRLAPTVSPKKTWEGAVASVIASIAVAFLVFHFDQGLGRLFTRGEHQFYTPSMPPLSAVHKIVLGIVTNVAAQFGDLFESAIKRGAQVKDSGSLLPGHGGVLDRIDALLFALPVVWYYAALMRFPNS